MKKISMILCFAMILSIIAASNLPFMGATTENTIIIKDPATDPGDWYDDNIFEIEFTTAETVKMSLSSSENPAYDIETLKTVGVPVKININSTERNTVSGNFKISERTNDGQISVTTLSAETSDTVNGVKIGKVYLLEAKVPNESGTESTYIGTFGIDITETYNLYSDMTVIDITEDLEYQNEVFADKNRLIAEISAIQELSEASDLNLADIDENGYIFNVNSGEDDFYKITSDVDGFVDIVLYTPDEDGDLDLVISKYNENTEVENLNVYAESSSDTQFEYIRFYAQEGEEYIINVQSESTVAVPYAVSTSTYASPVWFPQWSTSSSGVTYWDETYMSNTYFTVWNSIKKIYEPKFFLDPTGNSTGITSSMCVLHCFAMTAYVKNKTTSNIFDIRKYSEGTVTGTKTTVMPDPYTVFLANNDFDGTELVYSNGNYSSSINATPYLAGSLYSKFNMPYNAAIEVSNVGTDIDVDGDGKFNYNELVSLLQDIISYSPEGINLVFKAGSGEHTISVRLVNGYIRIFDPGRPSGGSSDTRFYYNVPINSYFNTYQVRDVTTISSYKTFKD